MPPLDPDAVVGCLLGQAVGDMMGLPAENLGPRRIARLFPTFDRPRFLFGRGMGSDDTEHACMTAVAVALSSMGPHAHPYRPQPDAYEYADVFRSNLALFLRLWFVAGPPGIGLATLKACLKLWLFLPRSGVFSAGNGPAMRAAIIGVATEAQAESWRAEWVKGSTSLTHTDPKALVGALAVACAAALAVRTRVGSPPTAAALLDEMRPDWDYLSDDEPQATHAAFDEFRQLLSRVEEAVQAQRSLPEFAADLKLARGVSGYMYHTVPVAIFAFLRHPDDYRAAVEGVIRLGGDTDTVAAITGALVGARVGKAGIPKAWLERHRDWPWTASRIERLGSRLASRMNGLPQPLRRGDLVRIQLRALALPLTPFRNLFFFLVVLAHVLRRLLPPY